ncbi:MAG: hypothetical protein WBI82_09605 [Sphaerochaeta sp.]
MKKTLGIIVTIGLLCSGIVPVFAGSSSPDYSVSITSPSLIDGKPVYSTDIVVSVKNLTDHPLGNLVAYLMILDVDRKQTYPVDEFGPQAYQSRSIDSLQPGATSAVTIPVKILYVGNFRFSVSVMDLENNQSISAQAIPVHMITDSKLNKPLIIWVSTIIPILVILTALILGSRRKRKAL